MSYLCFIIGVMVGNLVAIVLRRLESPTTVSRVTPDISNRPVTPQPGYAHGEPFYLPKENITINQHFPNVTTMDRRTPSQIAAQTQKAVKRGAGKA